ncbi:Iigp1 [Symbiodinium sp. KB8]|nr:Iigp1 [Symbiodinium sp. KB8]
MSNAYEVRIRATGEMATVLRYDAGPSPDEMAVRVRHADGRRQWYKPVDVDMFEPVPPGYVHGDEIQEAPAQAGLQEPLLSERRRQQAGWLYYLQVAISVVLTLAVVLLALDRNSKCDPEDLRSVDPPYDGDLLPFRFILSERKQFIKLSRMIDVYDENWVKVGYFYDLNLFFFMRFGYSDASGRIWFEARRPNLFARIFQLGKQYYLQRCDVGANGRHGGIFDLREDFWKESWFCSLHCVGLFNITRRPVNEHSTGDLPVANAVFNSTLEWHHKNMVNTFARHRWYMKLTDPLDGSLVAHAEQHFRSWLPGYLLSNWTVRISEDLPLLPNWVVGFAAALDDVDRSYPNHGAWFAPPRRAPGRELRHSARQGMSGFSFVPCLIVGGVAHWLANFFNWTRRPKSAPGPTQALLRRQKRAESEAAEARKMFKRASQFFVNTRESTGVVLNRSAPEIVSCARRRLEGAVNTLRNANKELRDAQADLLAYPVPEYLAPAQEQGAIMIGVTGYPGVGKSSWVNAVRRVSSPNDPDYAEICVDGPTMEPMMYKFPVQTQKPCVIWVDLGSKFCGPDVAFTGAVLLASQKHPEKAGRSCSDLLWQPAHLIYAGIGFLALPGLLNLARLGVTFLFGLAGVLMVCASLFSECVNGTPSLAAFKGLSDDLPGVGTAGYPPEKYLQKLGIRHFDVVVLITDQRFTEAELLLLDDLRHWNVPFFMVRNKIDLDVERELDAEQDVLDNRGFGDQIEDDERREIVRDTLINVKEDLSILHHVDSVYCISSIKQFWHSCGP